MDDRSLFHLVGSVPLPDSASVFSRVGQNLGAHLCRVPDGETGDRGRWISFQRLMLNEHPAVSVNADGRSFPTRDLKGNLRRMNELFVLDPALADDAISFLPLGYCKAATDSYPVFLQQKQLGNIGPDTRFQVSLPTPFATGLLYFHPEAHAQYMKLMKQDLLHELALICQAVDHRELAIQWDCCPEILLLEGYFPPDWQHSQASMAAVLAELGNAVPADVELGYHFCYGSPVDEPLVLQKDMAVVTQFCNAVQSSLNRALDFVHLPVSAIDADQSFFEPLGDLALPGQTDVYLGLLNPRDPDGDVARIRAARQILPDFGVATECGWGRKSDQSVDALLNLHSKAAIHLQAR